MSRDQPAADCPRCHVLAEQENTARRCAEEAERQAVLNITAIERVRKLCARQPFVRASEIERALANPTT